MCDFQLGGKKLGWEPALGGGRCLFSGVSRMGLLLRSQQDHALLFFGRTA